MRLPAHVVERAAVPRGDFGQRRHVHKPLVQPARQVHALLERLPEHGDPALGNDPAAIGDADDDGLYARRGRLLHRHLRQLQIGLAARKAQLADAPVGAPVLHPLRRLGGQLIGGVAEKHQIGVGNRHRIPYLRQAVVRAAHPSQSPSGCRQGFAQGLPVISSHSQFPQFTSLPHRRPQGGE
jgi:hypothetical protein